MLSIYKVVVHMYKYIVIYSANSPEQRTTPSTKATKG